MKFSFIIAVLVIQLGVFTSSSYACWPTGDVTWTGENNADWNSAENYSGNWGALPGARDRVIVDPDVYINAPVISDEPIFSPGSIYLKNGAQLTVNTSADTEFFEIGKAGNLIIMNGAAKLTVNEDFILTDNNGAIAFEGSGVVDIGNDIIFANPSTSLVNNLSGNFNVGRHVLFDRQSAKFENNGTVSIAGDFKTGGSSANNNRIINHEGGVLTIDGDVNFTGAVNYIDNEGIINQGGNFAGINSLCSFNNKQEGVWKWTYTGGATDEDMSAVMAAHGTVIYGGLGDQSVIPINYHNLTIAGSGIKNLGGSTSVKGILDIAEGHVALNDFDLMLLDNASITNASASGFVVANGRGRLIQNNIGSGGRTGDIVFPIGVDRESYTPLTINNTSGTADDFSVSLLSGIYDNGYSGVLQTSNAVNRTWLIDEGTAGGSDATLIFQWDDLDQLSEFNPINARIIHYEGSRWETLYEGNALGAGPYTMSVSGVNSFSPFGIESEAGVLPVELLHFKVAMKGQTAVLEWATASEINNDFFTIEQSRDLETFKPLGVVNGRGTSAAVNNYHFYHSSPDYGISYYRLKQTDFDGKASHLEIVKLNNLNPFVDMNIYPVPNQGKYLNIKLTGMTSADEVPVVIYNGQGQVVHQQTIRIDNFDEIKVHFSKKLPAGIYTLHLRTSMPHSKQFVVR